MNIVSGVLRRLPPAVLLTAGALAGAAPQNPDYALIVSRAAQADRGWRRVVEVLSEKHRGAVIVFDASVEEALPQLRGLLPRYASQGKRFPIRAPNPKVYLPVGNCLMGHIDGTNTMALAFLNSGGVHQMIGYTVLRTSWVDHLWEREGEVLKKLPAMTEGLAVSGVRKDGPAAQADIQPGDVVTAVEGRKVVRVRELLEVIRGKKPGEQLNLTLLRVGSAEPLQRTLKLARAEAGLEQPRSGTRAIASP